MICFPNAKINLGLYVTERRADGYNNISTLFYPIPLIDALEIIPTPKNNAELEVILSGNTIDGLVENNLCFKAYHLLKKDYPNIPNCTLYLNKNIPMGAGLGGGSADGAFTLKILNKLFHLDISEQALQAYALQLGSDCPFFILNQPCLAYGRGEQLKSINLHLEGYYLALVNPNIHINTGQAFSNIQPKQPSLTLEQMIALPINEWKQHLKNDFEIPIFNEYPEIKKIKEEFYQKGALYASMTGTGSTVFALFKEDPTALLLKLKEKYFLFIDKL